MNKIRLSILIFALSCTTVLSANAQDVKGDAKAGEKKTALCLGCHGINGYQASFPEIYKVPKISGQGAKYVVSALTAYKKGDRKHPTMGGIALGLSDQDIADLAAYYEVLGNAGSVPLPGKAAAGNAIAAELVKKGACVSCHGENFSKPIDPSFPKIAGQYADYLFVALKSYKAQGNSTWGRNHPVMGGVATQFSNADMKELANYIGSLPGELQTVQPSRFR